MSPEVAEELRLLRQLWHWIWNEKAEYDGGEFQHVPWGDANREDELCSAIEDHYSAHGFPEVAA